MHELLRPVLSEETYRICPALSAVTHHAGIQGTLVHQPLAFQRCRGSQRSERGTVDRYERQYVHYVRTFVLHVPDEFGDVLFVDPGDHDDVDLDGHPQFGAHADPLLLTVEEGQGALLS